MFCQVLLILIIVTVVAIIISALRMKIAHLVVFSISLAIEILFSVCYLLSINANI